jgi:hypothetical protein
MKRLPNLGLLIGCMLVAWPWEAGAVAQWARKYNEPCSSCHNIFPRPNYYGERYLRNGYQKPDSKEGDGDKVGKKKIGDELVLGKVEDWFGARLNVSPLKAKTNAITVDGDKRTQYGGGNPEWLQLFVAGSVFKDVSIYIESEFTSGAFKFNWYYLGFHNLAGDLVNFQIGNVSPLLFASYQNRLPLFPMVRNEAMRLRSSVLGAGATAPAEDPTPPVAGDSTVDKVVSDGLDTSSARPGIQYYGEAGPAVWWVGVSPGSSAADVNQFLNYWAGARFEIIEDWESALEGSSVSLHYAWGTDARTPGFCTATTCTGSGTTAGTQIENNYFRIVPSINVRLGDFDFQAGYIYGEDDNIRLAAVPAKGRFDGWTTVLAYVGDSRWVPGLQWDVTDIEKPTPSGTYLEMNRLTPTLTYLIRENMRVTAYAAFDLLEDSPAHPAEQHEFIVNIRAMF